MKSTKRIGKLEVSEIALESPVVSENLPFSFVHYPNHYGTFMAFSKEKDSEKFFCLCNKKAIENHFELTKFEHSNNWSDDRISAPLSSHFFPNSISELSQKKSVEGILKFEKKLCHRCNMSTPSLRFCHSMYGSNFKQYYGWYITQTSLRQGIRNLSFVEEYTPTELKVILQEAYKLQNELNQEVANEHETPINFEERHVKQKRVSKLKRQVEKEIENETRLEFGFRKIGEGNVSESILIRIVKKLFPDNLVETHHRPKWLNGLELDIFLPHIKTGIEYQGQQHYFPIKAWGGQKAFKAQKERDELKKKICSERDIKLIEVDYTEPLTESYIKEKICA
jgi:hypothetical protein